MSATPESSAGDEVAETGSDAPVGSGGLADASPRHLGPRRLLLDAVAALTLCGLIAAVAFAFARSWLPPTPPGGADLGRYSPWRDGAGRLELKEDQAGRASSWDSVNLALVASGRASAVDLRKAPRDAIEAFLRQPGEERLVEGELTRRLADVQVVEQRRRAIDLAGQVTSTVSISLREGRGEFLVGYYDPARDRDLLFDPPLLMLPADLEAGRAWTGAGQLGSARYTWRGEIVAIGPVESQLGRFDDCLEVHGQLVTTRDGSTAETRHHDWLCADLGLVESRELDGAGVLRARTVVVGTEGDSLSVRALPPPQVPPDAEGTSADRADDDAGDPSIWRLSRVGRLGRSVASGESTIPPTWIPSDPPMLLAAAYDGDLVAFDGENPTGSILWRFHTGGIVYGPPAFDPVRGRIYFGASDKRLYALDTRGLFLWAFETGDNVVSRPVVVGDVLVFGSEDRTIYGLDAATGALRWTRETGGPIVSAPAVAVVTSDPEQGAGSAARQVVVVGSDDGATYGLDPESGDERWIYPTDEAIEAPIVVADDTVFVVSRAGTVSALDPASGESTWIADVGGVLRTAPAVGGGRLFVIDTAGRLSALDQATGQRLWTLAGPYVGPPVLVDETLVVALRNGAIHGLSLDGNRQGEWAGKGDGEAVGPASVTLGLTTGGGALWLADTAAVVQRLGPRLVVTRPLEMAWVNTVGRAPFRQRFLFTSTPAEHQGRAVVLDSAGNVYVIDPLTGRATAVERPAAPPGAAIRLDPVVSEDTLLVVAGDILYASSLVDGAPRWQLQGGTAFRPAVVSDNLVFWLTWPGSQATGGDAQSGQAGMLHALDLQTGALRWRGPLGEIDGLGSAVVSRHTVYTSTPPAAFAVGSGDRRWQTELDGDGLGGPAIDEAGDTLYVGLVGSDGETGAVVALDAADGRLRWRTSLEAEYLNPLETLWLSDRTVVVPTDSGAVVGLDATSGARLWRYAPPIPRLASITVAEGRVWLVLENGEVLALDALSGRVAARFGDLQLNLNGVGLAQRPAIIGGRAIVPVGQALLGLKLPADDPGDVSAP